MRKTWTRERVEKFIYTPLLKGYSVVEVAEGLGMRRQRVYILLQQYRFKTPNKLRKARRKEQTLCHN